MPDDKQKIQNKLTENDISNNDLLAPNNIVNVNNHDEFDNIIKEESRKNEIQHQRLIDNNYLFQSTPKTAQTYNTNPFVREKLLQRYTSDKYGNLNYVYPEERPENLYLRAAQNQNAFSATVNSLTNWIPKSVVRLGTDFASLFAFPLAIVNNDWSELNDINKINQDLNTWLEDSGWGSLSENPDKMVGDYKGFMNLFSEILTSAATVGVESLIMGGPLNSILKGLEATGNSIKTLNAVKKIGTIGTAFTLTGVESIQQGVEAYNKTIANFMKEINPATGHYYTKEEVKDKATLAANTAFIANQVIGTALNYIGLEAMILPEFNAKHLAALDAEKMFNKGVNKFTKENLKNLSINDEVIQNAKKWAKSEYGLKSILTVGASEYIEEDFNNWATDFGVKYAQLKDKNEKNALFEVITDKDIWKDNFLSEDAFWTGMSGFIGGAGQKIFTNYVGGKVSSFLEHNLLDSEIIARDKEGKAIMVSKKVKEPKKYIEVPDEITDKIINEEENEKIKTSEKSNEKSKEKKESGEKITEIEEKEIQEIKTYKKPKKLKENATEEEKQKYENDLKEYKKARREEFKKTQAQKMQESYIDMFTNELRTKKYIYNNMVMNLDIIQSEYSKKNENKPYSKLKIDNAKRNIFNALSYYYFINNSEDTLINTFETIKNTDAETLKKENLIEDVKEKENINKLADETITNIKKVKEIKNNIDKTFETKTLIDEEVKIKLFNAKWFNHILETNKNEMFKELSKELEKRKITLQELDEQLNLMFSSKNIKIDKNNLSPYEYLIKNLFPELLVQLNLNNEGLNYIEKELLKKINDNFEKEYGKYKNEQKENDKKFDKKYSDIILNYLYYKLNELVYNSSNEIQNNLENENVIKILKEEIEQKVTEKIKKDIKKQEIQKEEEKENIKKEELKKEKEIIEKKEKQNLSNDNLVFVNESTILQGRILEFQNKLDDLIDKISLLEDKKILKENEAVQYIIQINDLLKSLEIFSNIIKNSKDLNKEDDLKIQIIEFNKNFNNLLKEITNIIDKNNIKEEIKPIVKETKKDKFENEIKDEIKNTKLFKISEKFDLKIDIIEKLEKLLNEIEDVIKIDIKDEENIERAILYKSKKDKLNLEKKFIAINNLIYNEWKNKNIKNKDTNDFKHYIEYYNFLLLLSKEINFNINNEKLFTLFKNNLSELLLYNNIDRNIGNEILSYINENFNNLGEYIEKITIIDIENEQIKENFIANEIDIKESIDNINYEGAKNTSPHNSVSYLEIEYVKMLDENELIYIDKENQESIALQDYLKLNDEIYFEVQDIDNLEINDNEDFFKTTTWKEFKERNKDKGEEFLNSYIPIAILNKNKEIIGFVHDLTWLERNDIHIAENVDIEEEIEKLKKLRNNITKNNISKGKIINISKGVLNIEKNNEFDTLEKRFENKELKIGIIKNSKIYTNKDNIFNSDNIENIEFLENIEEGNIVILLPNQNFIAVPLLRLNLGIEKNIINSLIDLLKNNKFEEFIEMSSNILYLKNFNFEDLYLRDKNAYNISNRNFFNINKYKNNITFSFAHINDKINNSFIIYEFDITTGKLSYKQEVLDKITNNKKIVVSTANEAEKEEAFNILKDMLNVTKLNINLDKINNNEKFTIYNYINDKLEKIDFDNYNKFINNFLLTNIIEKKGIDENNNKIYSYTVQKVINFETEEIKEKKKKKKNIKQEEKEKISGNFLANVDDFKFSNLDLINKRKIDNKNEEKEQALLLKNKNIINKNLLQNDLKIEKKIEREFLSSLIFTIKNILSEKNLELNYNNFVNNFDIFLKETNEYNNMLLKIKEVFNEENWENFRNKEEAIEKVGLLKNLTYNEIIKEIDLNEKLLNNQTYFKEKLLKQINIAWNINFEEEENLKEENEEYVGKQENWDKSNHEIDVNQKAIFSLKLIASSIPDCVFQINQKTKKIELDENKQPILKYNSGLFNLKKAYNDDLLLKKVHTLLTSTKVDDKNRFEKYINLLKNSNEAVLYLFAKEIEKADDKTKASFINVFATQKTNSYLTLFKTQYNNNKLENNLTILENSEVDQINNMIENFKEIILLNKDNIFLEKNKDGEFYYNFEKIKYYKDNINKLTSEQIQELFQLFGINFKLQEINLFIKNNSFVNKFFNYNENKINILLSKSGILSKLLKSVLENQHNLKDVKSISILNFVNKYYLKKLAKIKIEISGNFKTTTFKNGEGNKVRSIMYETMANKQMNILSDKNNPEFKKLSDSNNVVSGKINYIEKIGEQKVIKEDYRSYWVKRSAEGFSEYFNIGIEDSIKKLSKYSDAKHKTKQDKDELFMNKVFLFINNNDKETMKISPLTFSDKKTSLILNVPKINFNLFTDIESGKIKNYIINSKQNGIFYYKDFLYNYMKENNKLKRIIINYLILPEVDRINKHIEKIFNKEIKPGDISDNELYGGYFFYFNIKFNLTNKLSYKDQNGEIKEIVFRNDNGKIIVTDEVIEAMVQKYINEFVNSISVNYENLKNICLKHKRIELIDSKYLNRFEDDYLTNYYKLLLISMDFTINYELGTAEYTKTIGSGFYSTYKAKKELFDIITIDDYEKIKNSNSTILEQEEELQLNSNKKTLYDLIQNNPKEVYKTVKGAIDEYTKRTAKDIAPQITGYWKDKENRDFTKYQMLYIKEPKTSFYDKKYKEMGINGYKDVEGADASELISFKEYIINEHAYSHLDDELYYEIMKGIEDIEKENLEIIEKLERENKSYIEILENLKTYIIPKHLKNKLLVGNRKPVYSWQTYNEILGRRQGKYIKTASFPLVSEIVNSTELNLLNRHILYLEAKNKTSVRLSYVSGVKEGAINVKEIWKIKDDNLLLNKDILKELKGEELDRMGYGIQLEENLADHRKKITLPTQANKLLFSGLMDKFSSKIINFNNKEFTISELKFLKEEVRKNMFNIEFKKILKEFGLKETSEGLQFLENFDKKDFVKKLKKIIEKEMNSRNYTDIEKLYTELTSEENSFMFPLSFIPKSSRFESLLLSIITNRIIKIKINGKHYVNTPGNGIMTFEENAKYMSEIIFTNKYNGKLNYIEFLENDEKVQYAQCFLSSDFLENKNNNFDLSDFIEEKNNKKYLNINKIDEDILKIIGIRIPTQSQSSMLILEIVGFLPNYMKGNIILPLEITKQMGSDNDHDHLYVLNSNTKYEIDKNDFENFKKNFKYDSPNYEKLKKELNNLTNFFSEENIKQFKKELNKDEIKLLNFLIKKLKDKPYKILFLKEEKIKNLKHKKYFKILQEKIKLAKDNFEKQKYLRESGIKELKEEIKIVKKETYKEAINKLYKEKGKLIKLQYDFENLNNNDKEQLENIYIDIFHSVLSDKEIAKKMLQPLDKPYLSDESDRLKEILNEIEIINPLSADFSVNSYINNQIGKIGVAVQSLISTFLSIVEDKNLKLTNKIIELPDRNIELNLANFKVGNQIKHIKGIGVGYSKTKDNEEITNSIINEMLQSECVDNAKNLRLSPLNYNLSTFNIINALILLNTGETKEGIPLETIFTLINQPVIKDFVKNDEKKGNVFEDFIFEKNQNIFYNLYIKYTNNDENIKNEIENNFLNNEFYFEDYETLTEYIENPDSNESKIYQAKLAYYFYNNYENLIEISNIAMKVASIDSKSVGKTILDYLDRINKLYKIKQTNIIENIQDIFIQKENYTEIGRLFEICYNKNNNFLLTGNLEKEIFVQNSNNFNNLLDILKNSNVEISYTDNKEKIWKSFKQSLFNLVLKNLGYNTFIERERLLKGKDSLAVRLNNYKNEKWFKNNLFLSQIFIDLNENELIINEENEYSLKDFNKAVFVKINAFVQENNLEIDIMNDFNEIYLTTLNELEKNPNDETLEKRKEFLEDLILYPLLAGGIQSYSNWMKYLHPLILENLGILEELRNILSEEIGLDTLENMSIQIIQNNPKLSKFINVEEFKDNTKIIYSNGKIIGLETNNKNILSNKFIRIYDRNNKENVLFTLDFEKSNEIKTIYKRISILGSEDNEFSEFDFNNKIAKSSFRENYTVDNINIEKIIINDNINYNNFKNIPTIENSLIILNNLLEDKNNTDLFKFIKRLFINNKRLLNEYKIIFDNNLQARAEINHNNKTISFNLEIISKSENINEELKELIIHEFLHVIFKDFVKRGENNLLNDKQKVAYKNLENLFVLTKSKIINENKEDYELYLKQKNEKNGIDENLAIKFAPLKNLSEFLSYGWSNKNVQEFWTNIYIEKDNNKFENIKNLFKEILTNILKLISEKYNIKLEKNLLSKFVEDSLIFYTIDYKENKDNNTSVKEIKKTNNLLNNMKEKLDNEMKKDNEIKNEMSKEIDEIKKGFEEKIEKEDYEKEIKKNKDYINKLNDFIFNIVNNDKEILQNIMKNGIKKVLNNNEITIGENMNFVFYKSIDKNEIIEIKDEFLKYKVLMKITEQKYRNILFNNKKYYFIDKNIILNLTDKIMEENEENKKQILSKVNDNLYKYANEKLNDIEKNIEQVINIIKDSHKKC